MISKQKLNKIIDERIRESKFIDKIKKAVLDQALIDQEVTIQTSGEIRNGMSTLAINPLYFSGSNRRIGKSEFILKFFAEIGDKKAILEYEKLKRKQLEEITESLLGEYKT